MTESNINFSIGPLTPLKLKPTASAATSPAEAAKQFGAFLNDAMNKLNDQQNQVDKLNQKFVVGELPDVHALMLASEKSALGLELTVQIRNKVIEAYQEVMRTQI